MKFMSLLSKGFSNIQGTNDYGIWYAKRKEFTLKAYIDANWVDNIDDRKSTFGATLFLGNCLVSWVSKKQNSISLSTTETEYIIAATCCSQILWMEKTLKEIKVELTDPIPIICDNTSAISNSKNLVMQSKAKQIPINFHFLREKVATNVVRLEYVASKD